MSKRAPGEGSIYQRANGTWVAVLNLGFDAQGRRQRKYFYGASQKQVRLALERAKAELERGLPVRSGRAALVSDLLDAWLDHKRDGWSPRTHQRHAEIVRVHLAPRLGRHLVTKLTVQHVQALLDEKRASGLSPRTVQYIRGALRAALNQGAKWDMVSRNVAALAEAPALEHREVDALSPSQARTLLRALEGDRLGPLYTVAVTLGLRQSEIIGLRWQDVDLDVRTVTVRQTIQHVAGRYHVLPPKTDRSRRTLALPAQVVVVLRSQRTRQLEERLAAARAWQDTNLVFTNETGGPLYGPHVTRHLHRVLARAGLPRFRFHDLRHTAASLLLAMGVDMVVIQKTLGHSSITTTANIYAHVMPELQEDAAARMDRFLTGPA